MDINNEKDLAKAVEEEEPTLDVTGDMVPKIRDMYKINYTLWIFVLSIVALIIVCIFGKAGDDNSPFVEKMMSDASDSSGVGMGTLACMVGLASFGGTKIVNKLRKKYIIVSDTTNRMVLKRK